MKPVTRKKIETFLLKYLDKIDISKENGNMYRKLFPKMTDRDFEKLISKPIPIYDPNGGRVKIDHIRNIAIMRELGYEPEQYCWLTDPRTGACSKTSFRHIVLPLPVRRQTQMIDKKISIAEHNRTIDASTGQPVGPSKGSSFSFPQIYTMYAKGYDATIREFIKTRGGNTKAYKTVDRNIRSTGSSSQAFEGEHETKTRSSVTQGIIFRAMHLGNSL